MCSKRVIRRFRQLVLRYINFSGRRLDGHLYLLAVRNGAGMRSEVDTHAFLPPSVVAILSADSTKQPHDRGLAWEERRAQPGELVAVEIEAATSTTLRGIERAPVAA